MWQGGRWFGSDGLASRSLCVVGNAVEIFGKMEMHSLRMAVHTKGETQMADMAGALILLQGGLWYAVIKLYGYALCLQ